jgi:hypothetical protein
MRFRSKGLKGPNGKGAEEFCRQILDSGNPEPIGRTVETPLTIDDFTIVLPEFTDMATCELEIYDGLDRLWQMVERYKMTAPISFQSG